MSYAVEAENIHKRFKISGIIRNKYINILNGINFKLKEGDHLAIIGPNGSGKTTLLKTIAHILIPDDGTLRIFGFDAIKDSKETMRITSFVSPAFQFQKKLTLKEILKFYAGVQGSNIDNVMGFIREMGIEHMLPKKLEAFSEGQKAAARFAVGLMKQPKLFLIDEVVANLDVKRKEMILDALESISDRVTFIIIDHDPGVVERLCTKVLLLRRGGKVLTIASIKDLMDKLPYRYDIEVTPLNPMSDTFWDQFDYKYDKYGQLVRFLLQSKEDVVDLSKKLVDHADELSFQVSGISMEDIYYYWLRDKEQR